MQNSISSPTLTNCTFTENSAEASGGGMYNLGNSNPSVTNCTFSGNTAVTYGGGMHNSNNASPTMTNCTFTENLAEASGGGMYNSLDSLPTVESCTFLGNSAANGGGMYNYDSSPTVTNSTFSGNTATFWGGGMYNESSSSPAITNCTFTENSASYYGGGIRNKDNSKPTVTNSILWRDGPDEIFNSFSSPSVTYSDIQGGYTGTGNINADPMFVEPANGDFHLKQGSPCIDTGTSSGAPSTDFEGDPRPQGAGYDMGADEYVVPIPPPVSGRAMPWIPLLLMGD